MPCYRKNEVNKMCTVPTDKKVPYRTMKGSINTLWRLLFSTSSIKDPDPESGAFFTLWIREPVPASGMNNLDHIYESLKINFGVKILKFFDADPGSGMKEKHCQKVGIEFNLNKVSRLHETTSSVGTQMQHTQGRFPAALTWKNAIIIAAVQRSDPFLRAASGCGGG
jgi:hypothetical protein